MKVNDWLAFLLLFFSLNSWWHSNFFRVLQVFIKKKLYLCVLYSKNS